MNTFCEFWQIHEAMVCHGLEDTPLLLNLHRTNLVSTALWRLFKVTCFLVNILSYFNNNDLIWCRKKWHRSCYYNIFVLDHVDKIIKYEKDHMCNSFTFYAVLPFRTLLPANISWLVRKYSLLLSRTIFKKTQSELA